MQRGFTPLILVIITTVVVSALVGGYYFYQKNQIKNINSFEDCVKAGYKTVESELSPAKCTTPDGKIFTEQVKACTQEAKICPDGSSVGRTGPNCEFTACPVDETANWKTQTIDLYKLQLSLPSDWTIKEINRRSEPTGPADPKAGHDCADYAINSSDGYIKLTLRPLCGYGDSGPSEWPSDTVVVKELGDKKFIIRYFDSRQAVYKYTDGVITQISDQSGMHETKMHSGGIAFGKDQSLIFLFIDLVYSGANSSKDQYLKTTDEIITSIKSL